LTTAFLAFLEELRLRLFFLEEPFFLGDLAFLALSVLPVLGAVADSAPSPTAAAAVPLFDAGALGFAATRAAFFLALLDRDRLLERLPALGLLAARAAFLERERDRDLDLLFFLGDLAFFALLPSDVTNAESPAGALGLAATRAFFALRDRLLLLDRLFRFAGALGLLAARAAAFRDRDRLLDPLRRLPALGLLADRAAFLERDRERLLPFFAALGLEADRTAFRERDRDLDLDLDLLLFLPFRFGDLDLLPLRLGDLDLLVLRFGDLVFLAAAA